MKITLSKKHWENIQKQSSMMRSSQLVPAAFQPATSDYLYDLDSEVKINDYVIKVVTPVFNDYHKRYTALGLYRRIPGKRLASLEDMKQHVEQAKNRQEQLKMWVAKNVKEIKRS